MLQLIYKICRKALFVSQNNDRYTIIINKAVDNIDREAVAYIDRHLLFLIKSILKYFILQVKNTNLPKFLL